MATPNRTVSRLQNLSDRATQVQQDDWPRRLAAPFPAALPPPVPIPVHIDGERLRDRAPAHRDAEGLQADPNPVAGQAAIGHRAVASYDVESANRVAGLFAQAGVSAGVRGGNPAEFLWCVISLRSRRSSPRG